METAARTEEQSGGADPATTFRVALERHGHRLTSTAYLLCGDQQRAWRVTVEAFARCWPRWSLGAVDDLMAELQRFVVRFALAPRWRGRLRLAPRPATPAGAGVTGRVGSSPPVLERLLSLPETPRAVLALSAIERLDASRVAELLDLDRAEVGSISADMARSLAPPPPQRANPLGRSDEGRQRLEVADELRTAAALLPLSSPTSAEVADLVRRRRLGHLWTTLGTAAVVGLAIALLVALGGPSGPAKEVVLKGSGGAPVSPPPTPSSTVPTAPPSTPGVSPPDSTVSVHALLPATLPPVVSECSLNVTEGAGGNVAPLFCSDGGINVLAWQAYAKWSPTLMALGPGASKAQVDKAVCADTAPDQRVTMTQEVNIGLLSARYYGWKLPADTFTSLTCRRR